MEKKSPGSLTGAKNATNMTRDMSGKIGRFRFGLMTLMVAITALSILFAVPYGASIIVDVVKWVATAALLLGALIGVQFPVYLVIRRVMKTADAADHSHGDSM